MNLYRIQGFKELEGRRVSVALRGGDRIDDCRLISIGRDGTRTLWLFANRADTFVSFDDVADLWEAA